MRRLARGAAGKLGAPLVCLLVLAPALAAAPRAPADVLAEVDGEPITRSAFEQRLLRYFGDVVRDRFIVYEKFVEQSMKQERIVIADDEVQARLHELSAESEREDGLTLEQQLALRPGDPALFRHLVGLERALFYMTRRKYHIAVDQPVRRADVIKWLRSARVRIRVWRHPSNLAPGAIVRVGEEQVPARHAIDLLYLGFTREQLAELLREMAQQRLLSRLSEAAGIKIGEREIRRHVASPPPSEDLVIERRSLEQILKLARVSREAARDRARQELELREFVRRSLTEQDVKAEFDAHPGWYLGRTVRLRQVFVGLVDPGTGRPRSASEQADALRTLNEIKKELNDRGEFEKLAFVYSEDSSALRKGDIGYFPRPGPLGDALNEQALKLKRRQLSGPIQSKLGFHLIQATEVNKRTGRRLSDKKVRQRVIDSLIQLKLASWWEDQLRGADLRVFPARL